MKLRKVYTVVCALLVAATMAISAPASAQGLIGDTITSCFDNILDCPNDQHWDNDTAVVVDPGVEFTGIGNPNAGDVLTADFSGPTGSRLTITDCCTPNGSGVGAGVYRFLFSDLDFGNPITGVIIDSGNSLLPVQALSFTANSIDITLARFLLFSQPKSLFLDIVTLAPVIRVSIDIKPGSDPNSINLCSGGNVTVAVLTTDTFDATAIDPDSATLADADVRMAGKSGKMMAHEEDVDGDGDVDLVMQFATADLALELGMTDTEATVHALTLDDPPVEVEGTDFIQIVKDCE